MKTSLKRIISAVAVFGALSALCYSCTSVNVSAAFNPDGIPEEFDQYLVDWCLDELNTTYQIYRTGPVPAAVIQKLQALFYASAVSVGKKAYSQYEPDFEGNLINFRTGFYFDPDGNIHVTDLFGTNKASVSSSTVLVCMSDEHWTTFRTQYPIGEQAVTGCSLQINGDLSGSVRLLTYINGSPSGILQYYVENDVGSSRRQDSSYRYSYDLTQPAVVREAFPPDLTVIPMGYLSIQDENGDSVYLRNPALPITEDVLKSDPSTLVNYINNYITENYPLSEVVVPSPSVIETLPNDEYSGLPAGWNEINPVPLPDIDTPSLPVDGSEDFAESIDGLQFLSAFRDGLGFWARSVSWVCEQFPFAARVLLALGLLGLLAFIFWRWSL